MEKKKWGKALSHTVHALAELVRSDEIRALDAAEKATDPDAFRASLFG